MPWTHALIWYSMAMRNPDVRRTITLLQRSNIYSIVYARYTITRQKVRNFCIYYRVQLLPLANKKFLFKNLKNNKHDLKKVQAVKFLQRTIPV